MTRLASLRYIAFCKIDLIFSTVYKYTSKHALSVNSNTVVRLYMVLFKDTNYYLSCCKLIIHDTVRGLNHTYAQN